MINDNLEIEEARIGFRNFAGKEGPFNLAGKRSFCVFLDENLGSKLESAGWNVRWKESRNGEDDKEGILNVAVSYDNYPPKIFLISGTEDRSKKTILDQESVSLLDWADIKKVDIVITPYNWKLYEGTKNEKRGTKAYVKSMYVTIDQDQFEEKYSNVPDSTQNIIGSEYDGD